MRQEEMRGESGYFVDHLLFEKLTARTPPAQLLLSTYTVCLLNSRYIHRRKIDPTSAIMNPAESVGPYQPRLRPRKPPRTAPAMPKSIVTMKPPGSRPGITSFANAPTIKPKKIQPIMMFSSIRG